MSYCRWSSDHGECDVYVYEDVGGGWTTHVAGRRLKHKVPDEIKAIFPGPPDGQANWAERYMAARKAEQQWMDSLPSDEFPRREANADGTVSDGTFRTPKDSEYFYLSEIGPEAGQSFNDGTPGGCADRLESLRMKGFNVPERVIAILREEEAERASEGKSEVQAK